jgi:broad specificity phosphatase PhoE
VLIRHGETEWSLNGRHTGWTDLPLTERGRRQADELRSRLAPFTFRWIFTSPLQRAVETCRLAGLGDRAQVRDDLKEWDYGRYEGMTSEQINGLHPGWSLWRDGCPGGEDAGAVGRRADGILTEIRQLSGDVALFAHGHLLRVLGARWLGLPPDGGRYFALSTASISVLAWEHDDAVLLRWNLA